ncbi:LysR family transcriptional regulator [Parendozoicomonas haliclonae]|uniref:HTH-type transcriptional regulator MetR n=1 Tax=Parendozoicomonas haliclonae TaxID=1960125 RepID=A0A1X7ALD5_9GAMM|nr:LysR family transcriptional regulator [Parendozoicomonas haliclonae]SMA48343.1 HTH-type transcriptional regulator CynR [Parendozoicomonas haliclonae]
MSNQIGLGLHHLKTLNALRQTGSLVEAARMLHLTQSALSHQVKELESRIGMELFVRKSKPLRFTSAGLRLLTLADDLLPQIRLAEQDLLRLAGGESGRLHMAIECHSCFQWLMPTIDSYREHWPEVEMDFASGFNFAPLPALARAELDLVITSDPLLSPELVYIPLFDYEMLLAVSRRHPLAQKEWIAPTDLRQETLITYPVEHSRLAVFKDFMDKAGEEPAATRTAEMTLMMLQLVASQRGVCALPNWALAEYLDKSHIQCRPLGEQGIWCTLYAAIRAEHQEQPYIVDFLETAKETCFSRLDGIRPCKTNEVSYSLSTVL